VNPGRQTFIAALRIKVCTLHCSTIIVITLIESNPASLWRHIDFTKTAETASKIYFRFRVFTGGTRLERSKFIYRPNFAEISQSTAEIFLFPVSEYERPSYWNSTSGLQSGPLWHDVLSNHSKFRRRVSILSRPNLFALIKNPIRRRPPSSICNTVLVRSEAGITNIVARLKRRRLWQQIEPWLLGLIRPVISQLDGYACHSEWSPRPFVYVPLSRAGASVFLYRSTCSPHIFLSIYFSSGVFGRSLRPCLGLCESNFLRLEYSVELLIEY